MDGTPLSLQDSIVILLFFIGLIVWRIWVVNAEHNARELRYEEWLRTQNDTGLLEDKG